MMRQMVIAPMVMGAALLTGQAPASAPRPASMDVSWRKCARCAPR
jgi:hypothetical protein